MNRYLRRRRVMIPAAVVVLGVLLSSCDSSEDGRVCAVADVDNYSKTARFDDSSVLTFRLEQQITTYETGDCEVPSTNSDGVRILVTNSSPCHFDLNYSLSAFVGRIGWTLLGTIGVDGERTVDTGKVVKRNDVLVDQAEVILTGTIVSSTCP